MGKKSVGHQRKGRQRCAIHPKPDYEQLRKNAAVHHRRGRRKSAAISAAQAHETKGPNYRHFPENEAAGYDEEYFRGLTAEKMVVRFRKGRSVVVWELKDSKLTSGTNRLTCAITPRRRWKSQTRCCK
ncbi:MAG: terminase gpA endonuclease subunit [Oscillospiraceae bacterium]